MVAELPAELIARILDYLPVPDLCRAARVSLLFKDIVYNEARWTRMLKAMGAWSDSAAKQHFEDEAFRRQERLHAAKSNRLAQKKAEGRPKPDDIKHAGNEPSEASKDKSEPDLLQFTPKKPEIQSNDTDGNALHILKQVRSFRGHAKSEFAKVWIVLKPLYEDIAHATNPSEPALFKSFRLPEDQARMLRQIVRFSAAHAVDDWQNKDIRLGALVKLFESAVLREFDIGYDSRNEEQMKRYSGVLETLNGGESCIDSFCRKNVLFTAPSSNPFDCFDSFSDENAINLGPMGYMVDSLANEVLSQKRLIYRIFSHPRKAWEQFITRIFEQLLTEYVNKLTDYAQQQSTKTYLMSITGSFQHLHNLTLRLSEDNDNKVADKIQPVKDGSSHAHEVVVVDPLLNHLLEAIYSEQVSYYLEEEIAVLRTNVVKEVVNWDKQIQDESLQTEQLFLSGVSREVAKKNFLQSFTKVILMPVNVVGSVMPFPARPTTVLDETQPASIIATNNGLDEGSRTDLPTTELAARAAIMNSGLARIKRLLSLEVALQLIHTCKESIDRARSFVKFSGRVGEEAREQCESMFSIMLQALGMRHIQPGFDMALGHLKSFNPRKNKEINQVQPLVDFLELVHVGDLIQQMVDVFYNQELSGIVDKTDFLSPAVKEKKKFEQTIDEKVAEGLNRGLDVLIEQIDYILITTQKPTDFKPWVVLGEDTHLDLTQSETATSVVSCLQTHTDLLRGSTDKATLDVFFQEVGVRFFGSLCKHLKRQQITVEGGLKLISDLNYYHDFMCSLKQASILPYFYALKEVGNLFIISGRDGRAVGQVVGDLARFGGILRPEDVYEFAERRADWLKVKKHVDRVIYGNSECLLQ